MDYTFNLFNILDVSIILLYMLVIFILSARYDAEDYIFKNLAVSLGIVHLLMSLLFTFYSVNNPADSVVYFRKSQSPEVWESFGIGDGTDFISQLIYPFTYFLKVSYIGSNLIFSLISLVGLYRLYHVVTVMVSSWSWWLLLFLLPSMHFWTGFLGKDALIFFGITSIIYNIFFKKNALHYLLPIIIIVLTRFYIAVFLSVGIVLAVVFLSRSVKFSSKIIVGIISSIAMTYLAPFFFTVVGVGSASNIESRRDVILKANLEGGSGIDLSNSNLLVRFLSYLFRPFVFEARSFTSLMAAFENILWVIMFYFIIKHFKVAAKNQTILFWFCITSFITILLPAAYILSNLGIASRQKIMILPLLLYVFFCGVYSVNKGKINIDK